MHAGFPLFSHSMHSVLHLGLQDSRVTQAIDKASGKLLANGMALLVRLGFGYVMRDCFLNEARSKKALAFFEENFVIRDPAAHGGERFYQGKFLLRTQKPGDDMNVLLRFCPRPEDVYVQTPFGRTINILKVVDTEVLTERKANNLAKNPDNVDLVISFRDVNSIVGLIGREEVDVVGLLLENVVQLTGNVGHLFKLGAIAKNIELELGLSKAS